MAELNTLGAVIKSTLEAEADTNTVTDTEKTAIGTAVQPGDNISTLTNDLGFTDDTAADAAQATADAALPKAGGTMTGNIVMSAAETVDGRDLSADGAKLDLIEANADVTDTANVTAAGALMDSEVTNLAAVKAFDPTDYATAAQGATADSALQGVVNDTTPQLGGSLDVNSQKIVSVSNGNIDIEPHGTGNVLLGNFTFDADQTVGAGQDNYVMTYDNGTGLISLEAAAGGGSGDFLADGTVDMTGQFKTDVGTFASDVANGASAVGFVFNTTAAFTTNGAKLASWRNNGTEVVAIAFQSPGYAITLDDGASATKYGSLAGYNSTASGGGAIALGHTSVASGDWSTAFGKNCTAQATAAFCAGESNTINTASMFSSAVGYQASVDAIRTALALGAGRFSSDGDAQVMTVAAKVATTNATQTVMSNGGLSYTAKIPADASWVFSALVIGRSNEADGNDSGAYRLEGCLTRDESNNTALVGSVTVTTIAESAGASAWDVTAEADDTNEALAIKVTGEAATNIRWVAKVDIAQVTYA